MARQGRILIKLRAQPPSGAAATGTTLRPLFESQVAGAAHGLSAAPVWYVAELPDGGPNPWDTAHGRVAAPLGIDEADVLCAEPDLPQCYPDANEVNRGGSPLALRAGDCTFRDQDHDERPAGPGFAWHLGDGFSQLAAARAMVPFTDPGRTRIAHIDTGYDPTHSARPRHVLRDLERNLVGDDGNPNSATDPTRRHVFDNSGHGTGTLGILAGQTFPAPGGADLGGAPDAEILPIRIANSVVLFWTSVLAQAIDYAIQQRCDVVAISMGGLPSAVWNDAVNRAYESGICIVAASGDCFGGRPTHHVVHPARYRRTIAACGVMADGRPYYDLPSTVIEGNWGPASGMTAALAAYTPNMPWARLGCPDTVDMNGAGTAAATPQIAAAVALWYEKNKSALPRDWRRVEAVRAALFETAQPVDPTHFGRGLLRARDALAVAPRFNLPKTPADGDSFPFLQVLGGLGIAEPTPRERMLGLEMAQRYLMNPALQEAVPDPAAEVERERLRAFAEVVIADRDASERLRRHVAARYPVLFGSAVPGAIVERLAPPRAFAQASLTIPPPPFRRVRTYAVDPSFSTRLATAFVNEAVLKVPWEDLRSGPTGAYLEVVDRDADATVYPAVNLDDPGFLAQDGLAPSEGVPQFHQQMVYAVAMTTIGHFERALGRRVLWRPRLDPARPSDDGAYVPRLTIHPHALREANAYYDPEEVALLFGYFRASANDPGDHVPGSTVFTCLSHDIIAHETTHAILDGMHRRFGVPTNRDVLAFHEAFADIVALMQHFTVTPVLETQIARTRGDLETESTLGSLAVQFGRATGGRGALREAIGTIDTEGVWRRLRPDPAAYAKITAPHTRGAILVAAVFDAFLAIYKARTADLFRISTGGTGVLRAGALHPDLVRRLASEATTSAMHVLNICIRALDYIPPVDITFGEYLRGLITADFDLVADDPHGYRVAFLEAFRQRGIYPSDVASLSVDTLRWEGVDLADAVNRYGKVVVQLKRFADDCLYLDDREALFRRTRAERKALRETLRAGFRADPGLAIPLGLDAKLPFEVHELRRAERIGPDGQRLPQVIVAITQEREIRLPDSGRAFGFHGGATLVIELKDPQIRYAIRKSVSNAEREKSTVAFLLRSLQNPLTAMLIDPAGGNPFSRLHGLADLQ